MVTNHGKYASIYFAILFGFGRVRPLTPWSVVRAFSVRID